MLSSERWEISDKFDIHLNISKGDYDWQRIMDIIHPDKNMTLETILKSSESVDVINNFEQDTIYLQRLVKTFLNVYLNFCVNVNSFNAKCKVCLFTPSCVSFSLS